MSAIRVAGLTKTYGEGATATSVLAGVDLEVKQGELVMLVGPSGSGKTTLLSILGCVLTPTTGTVHLFEEPLHGRDESELPALRLAYVGFVFQGHNLLPALSCEDNVALPLRLRGWSRARARDEAGRMLDAVGLRAKAEWSPDELSGGQRQRVAIARALGGSPPLILADEPTSSLDAETGRDVSRLLRTLCAATGQTVVCVTHDDRILHLADRILHLEDGRVVEPPGRSP